PRPGLLARNSGTDCPCGRGKTILVFSLLFPPVFFAPGLALAGLSPHIELRAFHYSGLNQPRALHGGYFSPSPSQAIVRRDFATRQLVDSTTPRVHRALRVYRLRDLGGAPGRALHLWSVPVAVLLTRAVGPFAARVVWHAAL